MVPVFLCAGARKEISSESCTRPARRVVERSIPLPDCTGVKVFPYLLVLEKTLAFWIRFPYS